jgi:hypothetical protein
MIFFYRPGFIEAQVQPLEGTVPAGVVIDTRKYPAESQSRLEIYTSGQWSSDVNSQFDPAKPTLILIHGWRPGNLDKNGQFVTLEITDYWTDTTNALARRVNGEGQTGDINLLGWNWTFVASTMEIDPFAQPPVTVPAFAVFNEGQLLAKELKRLNPNGPIQLMGHSLGAKLAAVAALAAQTGEDAITIDQVSLMDGPELNTSDFDLSDALRTVPVHLEYEIPQLMLKNTYTETYASAFGFCYSELNIRCANINMKADAQPVEMLKQIVGAHRYPVTWYFGGKVNSIGTLAGTIDAATGDVSSTLGAAWSRVLNRNETHAQILAARARMMDGEDPNLLQNGLEYDVVDRSKTPYNFITTSCLRQPRVLTQTPLPFVLNGATQWTRYGQVEFDTSAPAKAILTTSSPCFLMGEVAVPSGNAVLSFTLTLNSPEASDKFTIFFNDQLIFTLDGAGVAAGSPISIGPVELTPFNGQTGTLTFCYASPSNNKFVSLSDMKITSWPYRPLHRLQTRIISGHGKIFPQYRYYEEGTTVTLLAIPHSGFRLWSWVGSNNDASKENINTVIVNESQTVSAQFQFDLFDPICSTGALAIITFIGLAINWLGTNEASQRNDD